MMGGHFYHKRVRTCVALFGSMFDDMHILRTAADGKVLSQVKLASDIRTSQEFHLTTRGDE